MCARPPLVEFAGTSGAAEPETVKSETTCTQDLAVSIAHTLTRAQTLDSDTVSQRHFSRTTLRTVKSGPMKLVTSARPMVSAPFSCTDEPASSFADVPSLRDQTCCSSEATGAQEVDCRSPSARCGGQCANASAGSQGGCSKGASCCKSLDSGKSDTVSSGEVPQFSPDATVPRLLGEAIASQVEVTPVTSSRPKPGVARVTVRRGVKRRPASSAEPTGDGDASKPTFGDLEDLWRKDSEARSYCTFVCSAPAMCRGGQEGLVEPVQSIAGDAGRRKRFKPNRDLQHDKAAVLALLA